MQVYILKASHVPQTKLHEKLIQATHVIVALVRDKEQLTNHINSVLGANAHSRTDSLETVHQATQTLAEVVEHKESSHSNSLLGPQPPPAIFPEIGLQKEERCPSELVYQDQNSSFHANVLPGKIVQKPRYRLFLAPPVFFSWSIDVYRR